MLRKWEQRPPLSCLQDTQPSGNAPGPWLPETPLPTPASLARSCAGKQVGWVLLLPGSRPPAPRGRLPSQAPQNPGEGSAALLDPMATARGN